MKRIAKVAQSAAPIQAVRPLTRPAILHTPRPLAGPSTPPSLPTSSRSLINRAYATTVPGSPSSIATELEQEQDDREADEVADLAVSIGGQGRRPLEIPESLEIPPNVRFEGFENVEEPINRGFRIHSKPDSPLSPISHPLSSLSSSNPTSPISSLPPVSLPAHIFAQPLRRDILHRCVVWYLSLLRSGNQSTKSRSTVNYSGRKLRQQKGTGKARVGDASSGIRRGGAPIFALHPRDHAQLLPRKVRALGLATALSSKLSAGLLRIVADLNEAEWSGTAEARRALRDGVAYPGSSTTGFLDEPSTSDTDASALEVESAQVATDTDAALLSELSPEPESGFITRFGNAKGLSILFIYPAPASLADIERLEQFKRSVRNLEGVEVLAMDEVEVYHVLKYKWCVLEKGVVDAISEVQEEGAEFDLQGMGEAVQDIQEGMEGLMSENQGQEHSRVSI